MCESAATHVVSQITRGMNAIFVFEKTVSSSEERSEIEGSLKAVVKKIPSFSISGEAEIEANGNLTKGQTSTTIFLSVHPTKHRLCQLSSIGLVVEWVLI